MSAYAYLRVSTDTQDMSAQRHGILEYANAHHLGSLHFIEDAVSGRENWQTREIGHLLSNKAQAGDLIIFAEISRMARSTLQVLEILEHCMRNEITVHVAKQGLVLDDSMPSRITATVLGLAAEIEREFISMRTKEALAKRKADGKALGRPKGSRAKKLKLDEKEDEIRKYLSLGINKRAISKLIGCAPSTLYDWMRRRRIKV